MRDADAKMLEPAVQNIAAVSARGHPAANQIARYVSVGTPFGGPTDIFPQCGKPVIYSRDPVAQITTIGLVAEILGLCQNFGEGCRRLVQSHRGAQRFRTSLDPYLIG